MRSRRVLILQGFIFLLLLELGCRFLPYSLPEPAQSTLLDAGRTRLASLRRYGAWRNGLAIKLPPEHDADVVFVGDSFVFGDRVREKDMFVSKIGEQTGYRVVNLGVMGTATAEYNRMVEVGSRYHPKIYVYCLFSNDLGVMNPIARPLSSANRETFLEGDDALFVRHLTWENRFQLFSKQLTYPLLSFHLLKFFAQPATRIPPEEDKFNLASENIHGHFFRMMSKRYWDDFVDYGRSHVKESVNKSLAVIEEANRFATSEGAGLLVVLIPHKEIVLAPLTKHPEKYFAQGHQETFHFIATHLQKDNISTLDLTSALRKAAWLKHPLYLPTDGHFSEDGHAVVTELLQPVLSHLLETKRLRTSSLGSRNTQGPESSKPVAGK